MHVAQGKTSPLDQLRRSLPDLPDRLREAGRYIAEHEFDATTRSMRDLASAAGLQPATFTRLAQAIGHAGWDEFRNELIEATRPEARGPFSDRVGRRAASRQAAESAERLLAGILDAEAGAVARIDTRSLIEAASTLQAAPRIWIAGFRSCRSVATLLHYQLSLFRSDIRLVGAVAPEDVDVGSFRQGDAVVVIGFAPYSRASVMTAREARRADCHRIVIADSPEAPIAEDADHLLVFDAGSTPAFFHSLTGAISIVQALAALVFERDGARASTRLRQTEARLESLAQYVTNEVTP